MKKQFLVIGLGRFGANVARTLTKFGHSVVGIDQSEDRIQRVAEEISDAIKCDATDAEILDSLDIPNFEAVIVAIGEKYIQNSILVTLISKEKGAKKNNCKGRDPDSRQSFIKGWSRCNSIP